MSRAVISGFRDTKNRFELFSAIFSRTILSKLTTPHFVLTTIDLFTPSDVIGMDPVAPTEAAAGSKSITDNEYEDEYAYPVFNTIIRPAHRSGRRNDHND